MVLSAGDGDPVSLARRLRDEFGLPRPQAGRYAALLDGHLTTLDDR